MADDVKTERQAIAKSDNPVAKNIQKKTANMTPAEYETYKQSVMNQPIVTGTLSQIEKAVKANPALEGINVSSMYQSKTADTIAHFKQNEQEAKINKASIGQKAEAWAYGFAGASDTAFAINKAWEMNLASEASYEDKSFRSGLNSDFLAQYTAQYNIPNVAKYGDMIMGAKNPEHLARITDFIRNDIYMRDIVDNSLGSVGKFTSSLVGATATDPIMALAGLPTIVPKTVLGWRASASALTTAGVSAGLSTSVEALRSYGDPSITLDENLMNIGIGMFADVGATVMAAKRFNIPTKVADTVQQTAQNMDNISTARVGMSLRKQDYSTAYKWSDEAPNANLYKYTDLSANAAKSARVAETLSETVNKPFAPLGVDIRSMKDIATDSNFAQYVRENEATVTKSMGEAVAQANTLKGVERTQALQELTSIANKLEPISPTLSKAMKDNIAGATKQTQTVSTAKRDTARSLGFNAYEKKTKMFKDLAKKKLTEAKAQYEKVGVAFNKQLNLSPKEHEILKTVQGELASKRALKSKSVAKDIKELEMREAKLITKGLGGEVVALNREVYQRLASISDEIIHDLDEAFTANILDLIPDETGKRLFMDSLEEDLSKLFGSDIRLGLVDGKLQFTGKANMVIENGHVMLGNKPLLAGTALAIGGATSAMADDGSSMSVSDVGLLLLAIYGGAIGLQVFNKARKANDGIINTFKSYGQRVLGASKNAEFAAQPENLERVNFFNKVANLAETGYMSSWVTVNKHGSEEAKKLLRELAENPQGYSGIPADAIKMQELYTVLNRTNISERNQFQAWLNETGASETLYSRALDIGSETPLLAKFREEVTRYIENPSLNSSKAIREHANVISKEMNDMFDEAVELEMFGYKEEKKAKNYFPRMVKAENISEVCRTEDGRIALQESIYQAIVAKIGTKNAYKAQELAESWVNYESSVSRNAIKPVDVDRFVEGLKKFDIDVSEITRTELLKASKISSDMMSRIKDRIPMDLDKFPPFKASVHGVESEISVVDIFERNSNDAFRRYANQMKGNIALAKTVSNFETEAGLRMLIDREPNAEVRDALSLYLNQITGRPLYDASMVLEKNINALKSASFGVLLGSVISMTPEMIKATVSIMSNSNTFMQGVRELRNIFSDIPKTSNLVNELMYSVNGIGGQVLRREAQFKGIDSMFNVQEDIGGFANKVTNAHKASVLFVSRLMHVDDALKRIAGEYNIYRLHDLANGKITMSPQRMARFGIDEELLNIVRRRVVKDGEEIVNLNFDKWTKAEQNRFRATLHQMMQERSSEVMIGGVPKAFVNNSAGRLLSFVGSFSAQMYNTHFLGGLRSMDGEEVMAQSAWLIGGLVSTLARDAIFGNPDRPLSEDELIKRTIMSSPALGAFSIATMFSDPVALSQANTAMSAMGNLATFGVENE